MNTAGFATVEDLAQRFGVSVDSIRKDLKQLQKEGKIQREYGGALRIGGPKPEQKPVTPSPISEPEEELLGVSEHQSIAQTIAQTFTSKSVREDAGRRSVAARAYMELNNGDAVFLGISRTNLFLADLIREGDKRLIVTTNMIDVLPRLSGNPKVTALATGGYLNALSNGFTGQTTISLLEPLLFTKVFLGAYGVNLDNRAVLAMTSDDARINEQVLKNGTYKFLLVDSEKFSIHGGVRYASVSDFSAVISDTRDAKIMQRIAATGTPILV